MELGLNGKVVVVTGGATGIGLETARAFCRRAARWRSADGGWKSSRKQKEFLGSERVFVYQADMTDLEQVETFAAAVAKEYGSIDVWINNAGAMWIKPLMEMSSEEFRREIDLNLTTVFHGAKAAYPYMKAQGRRDFERFFLRSAGPQCGAGNIQCRKGCREKSQRIHGNRVCGRQYPGAGLCAGYDRNRDRCGSIEKYGDALLADIPCRRFGTPEDLGKVLVFFGLGCRRLHEWLSCLRSAAESAVQNPQFFLSISETTYINV